MFNNDRFLRDMFASLKDISLLDFALAIKDIPSLDIVSDEMSPLISQAIMYERHDLISFILDSGADPNTIDSTGELALFYAIHTHNEESVAMLLRAGADPNKRGKNQDTSVHVAVGTGDVAITRILLEAGGDAKLKCMHNMSCLHISTSKQDVSMIKLLLEYGAEIHHKSDSGATPWTKASRYGNQEILNLFREYEQKNKAQGTML